MNVLLLDDDPFLLSMLKGALIKWGHNVSAYSNPDQCPAYCAQACPCTLCKLGCPDIILTDVNMPIISGMKFVDELKRKNCKCPRIGMMSGDWSDGDMQRASRLGVTIFSKPYDLPTLRSWISEDNRRVA
jgi:CheY-like chemotaxis protein